MTRRQIVNKLRSLDKRMRRMYHRSYARLRRRSDTDKRAYQCLLRLREQAKRNSTTVRKLSALTKFFRYGRRIVTLDERQYAKLMYVLGPRCRVQDKEVTGA